jgi:hypothetical protein
MPAQTARFNSKCPICHRKIMAGDQIVKAGRIFVCLECHKTEGHEDPLQDLEEMTAYRQKRRGYVNYAHYETAGERAERSMEASGGKSDCMYDS